MMTKITDTMDRLYSLALEFSVPPAFLDCVEQILLEVFGTEERTEFNRSLQHLVNRLVQIPSDMSPHETLFLLSRLCHELDANIGHLPTEPMQRLPDNITTYLGEISPIVTAEITHLQQKLRDMARSVDLR